MARSAWRKCGTSSTEHREAGLPRRPGREIRTTGFGPDRSFTACGSRAAEVLVGGPTENLLIMVGSGFSDCAAYRGGRTRICPGPFTAYQSLFDETAAKTSPTTSLSFSSEFGSGLGRLLSRLTRTRSRSGLIPLDVGRSLRAIQPVAFRRGSSVTLAEQAAH